MVILLNVSWLIPKSDSFGVGGKSNGSSVLFFGVVIFEGLKVISVITIIHTEQINHW